MLKFDITKAVVAGTIGLAAAEAYVTRSRSDHRTRNKAAAEKFVYTIAKVAVLGGAISAGLHFFRPIPGQEMARTMNIMKHLVVMRACYVTISLFSQVAADAGIREDQNVVEFLVFLAVTHGVVAVSYHTFKVMGFMQGGSLLGRQLAQYGIPFVAGWVHRR